MAGIDADKVQKLPWDESDNPSFTSNSEEAQEIWQPEIRRIRNIEPFIF